MSAVFCGVGSGVWVWGVVVWYGGVWCMALRGLRWTVLFGCAGADVGRSEAERGGAASCLGWTAGVAAPVAPAAFAVAVSPPGSAAGVLRAMLVWGVMVGVDVDVCLWVWCDIGFVLCFVGTCVV